MSLLLPLFPLLGSLSAGLLGRWLGARGAGVITLGCMGVTTALAGLLLYEVGLCGSPCSLPLGVWLRSDLLQVSWGLYVDSLTALMLVVITSISTLVHLYSLGYMAQDPHLPRFLSYLSLFTFFMLALVTADNFLQLFFGWEGVGLASYLLINFWFTRLQASKASLKAMLVNRVGDLGLALGMMLLFSQLKTLDFATAFACAPLLAGETVTLGLWEVDLLTTLCLLLFIGAVGKSAQLGLHTWLPDAMEGPTPVSALIHAATMVTAGVFLLARCSPLYEWAPQALAVVALVGACTCVFAATTGMMQNDLKRVIAYSTASQLGYMVLACGLSQYALGVFHLVNHAFFKALLFLGAGCVIHALGDAQDMRRLGGSVTLLPFTYALMGLGSLALVGVPFLTGYYSKDVILEVSHTLYTIPGRVGALFGSLVVALTTYYSLRLLLLTFLAPPRASRGTYDRAHEAGPLLALPLLPLALGSLFVGYLGREALIGVGTPFWSNALLVLPEHLRLWEAELLPQGVKFLPLGAMVVGASLAVLVQGLLSAKVLTWSLTPWGRGLYGFFNGRWFVDQVYNQYLSRPALGFGYHTSFRALDKGLLEVLGPRGVTSTATRAMQALSALQSGRLYHYALVMLLALTLGLGLSLALDLLQSLATPSMELGHPLSLTPSATLFKRLVLMALGSFLVLRQSSSSS